MMPQSELLSEIHACVKENTKTLQKLDKIISGNGEPEKGLIVRFDRVEQSLKKYRWVIGAVVVALLAAGADALAAKIF